MNRRSLLKGLLGIAAVAVSPVTKLVKKIRTIRGHKTRLYVNGVEYATLGQITYTDAKDLPQAYVMGRFDPSSLYQGTIEGTVQDFRVVKGKDEPT